MLRCVSCAVFQGGLPGDGGRDRHPRRDKEGKGEKEGHTVIAGFSG